MTPCGLWLLDAVPLEQAHWLNIHKTGWKGKLFSDKKWKRGSPLNLRKINTCPQITPNGDADYE
jgi:hypothetical protein